MYKKYSNKFNTNIVTIFAGEFYISNKQEVISTVLGSCVSACLYDEENKISGMNHFMLPSCKNNFTNTDLYIKKERLTDSSMRYGITAMEILIGNLQKKGAKRKNLKAKIFGGGNVINHSINGPTIGEQNITFVKAYLKTEGIKIISHDLGKSVGRKLFFLTEDHSVFIKRMKIENAVEKEKEYINKIKNINQKSDITFF